jgi:hypothetical protein
MSQEAVSVVPLLGRLQEHMRRLEAEVAALRADLNRMTLALARPVATYKVNGAQITITEADVEAVRVQLVRPHSQAAVRELALAYKLAEQEKTLPEEEQERHFWENVEAIRAEAIAKGVAVDDPMELIADD